MTGKPISSIAVGKKSIISTYLVFSPCDAAVWPGTRQNSVFRVAFSKLVILHHEFVSPKW
jgi:hypothetical protein